MPSSGSGSLVDSAGTSAFGTGPQPGPDVSEPVPEFEGTSDAAEREDRLGLLSNEPSPKPSLSALRQRASNISIGQAHRRGYSASRTNSHSGSGSGSASHSRTQSSHSGSSRSRAPSVSFSGISAAASQSSIELVQRMRANSSMARLEEDSGDAKTHSRSGSGATSDAVPSSGGENNTFGHPLRSTWHDAPQVPPERQQQPPTPVQEESSEDGRDSEVDEHGRLQPAQSRTSGFSGPSSVFTAPSTSTEQQPSRAPSEERRQAEAGAIPIPTITPPSSYGDAATAAGATSSSSYPDISTAPQSFVTAPATVEGSTTESSGGRTEGLESWGVASGMAHLRDPSRGGGQGQGPWTHPGPA
ncbi:OPT oligopeptide transporter [Favolaschia claudopus]|uniref:OPT oligopeptide transporter n=1 Tax=Favolaschia claudopus TaxID=2862362 RepID=A0AAW0CLE5_9AGAR